MWTSKAKLDVCDISGLSITTPNFEPSLQRLSSWILFRTEKFSPRTALIKYDTNFIRRKLWHFSLNFHSFWYHMGLFARDFHIYDWSLSLRRKLNRIYEQWKGPRFTSHSLMHRDQDIMWFRFKVRLSSFFSVVTEVFTRVENDFSPELTHFFSGEQKLGRHLC